MLASLFVSIGWLVMRAVVIIIAAVLVGTCIGVGVTYARFGTTTSATAWRVESVAEALPVSAPGASGAAKVSVDREEFDFGPVENDSIVSHNFRFTNTGTAPLTLKAGGTTCQKCTIAEIPAEPIAPGASAEVTVSYTTAGTTPKFRQSATILTNDPERPRVELGVTGSVTAILDVQPPQLVFSKLSVHEERTLEAKLINHLTGQLNVTGHEWSDTSTEKFVAAQFKPLDEESLKKANAKSGQIVAVTIKPGLPLGQYRQKLTLTTDLPGNRSVVLEVLATIASDISLVGGGWDEDNGCVNVGAVSGKQGAKKTVLVLIRGPHRDDVKLSVGEVSPSFLQVTIGEKGSINDGAVVQYPLSIEIPAGSPGANHLGSKLGKLARITIETTHPEAKQVKVPVRFAIEE